MYTKCNCYCITMNSLCPPPLRLLLYIPCSISQDTPLHFCCRDMQSTDILLHVIPSRLADMNSQVLFFRMSLCSDHKEILWQSPPWENLVANSTSTHPDSSSTDGKMW
eukprot:TRINITY_DN789_c0_g1_i1.p1 TRINITY_DN789_c0_g1~~TRINITY_DN789_c0_g1_i1.p1  ORF type:complete len:108 (+),score=13.14 TRINITY_DN789_c0_g1_i1:487-810(+)